MSFLPEVRDGLIVHKRPIVYKKGKVGLHLAPERKKKHRRRRLSKRQKRLLRSRVPLKYRVYIKSTWWSLRKLAYYRNNGKQCAICSSTKYIDLHHMIYINYGYEKDEHLVALCRTHHAAFHEKVGVKRDMVAETNVFVDEERQLREFPNVY